MILVSIIAYAYRWMYILQSKCRFIASFESVIIASALNFILPAKLGEVSRVVYLKKIYKYTINNSISALVVEKIFDFILLGIISVLATVLIFQNTYTLYIGYGFLLSGIISMVLIKTNIVQKFIIFVPTRFLKVYAKKSLLSINKTFTYMKLLKIFILTLVIWSTYLAVNYILFNYVVNFNLSFYQIFVIFVVSTIAFSLPITPGGIGVYEASIIMSLGWYGIDKENALMAGLILRIIETLFVYFIALIILFKKNITLSSLKKDLI
jgi:uncharacterized protein (TIRG00374 family)